MLGLIALTTSYPSPNRSTAPGAKFSVKTSAFFTISLTSASPRSDFRLTVCDRLLAFYIMKYYASPKPVRPASPPFGFSTLAMSAPIQASASVHVVPASNCVRSSTRIPERKPGDTGVTSIADSSSGKEVDAPAKGGPGAGGSVVAPDPAFANDRIYLIRPLPRPLRRGTPALPPSRTGPVVPAPRRAGCRAACYIPRDPSCAAPRPAPHSNSSGR